MTLSIRMQWLPKAGNRNDEYEDACWPDRALTTAQPVVRCAIADGATESVFAGLWAQQLVAAYGATGATDAAAWQRAVALEQARWQTQIAAKALPWYAEEKARQGAFAALLGVTLAPATSVGRGWQASAVGDCALFQVRNRQLLTSFPAEDAAFFSNRPRLIPSVPAVAEDVLHSTQTATGVLQPGDVLYLTTDALGQWFLRRVEAGGAPWTELEAALAQRKRGFTRWIAGLRSNGQLRNDDVTLLRIAWTER